MTYTEGSAFFRALHNGYVYNIFSYRLWVAVDPHHSCWASVAKFVNHGGTVKDYAGAVSYHKHAASAHCQCATAGCPLMSSP